MAEPPGETSTTNARGFESFFSLARHAAVQGKRLHVRIISWIADLTTVGMAFGCMVIADVRALVAARKNEWLGIIEWRVDNRGTVTADLGGVFMRGFRRFIPVNRTLPELAISMPITMYADDEDDTDSVASFYVRLEPEISIDLRNDDSFRMLDRVFNLNNVSMHPDLCGRGFFKGMIQKLETWVQEGFCNCLMVQNITNSRLMNHLKQTGWQDPLNSERRTLIRFSEHRAVTVTILD